MFDKSMTRNAHDIIKNHVLKLNKKELLAVDATVGNGQDLLFLAELEEVNHIVGFDIQEAAIQICYKHVSGFNKPIELFLDSHHHIDQYVQKVDIAMFNLGYLPTGNKEIVTRVDSSLEAIKKTIQLLSNDGILTIMTYPGHEEGYREHEEIEKYLSHFYDKEINIFNLSLKNTYKICPNIYVIIKRSVM
jgi:16S rRNA C1402 N4-methylase RsmH